MIAQAVATESLAHYSNMGIGKNNNKYASGSLAPCHIFGGT